jgi:hypothetical protein
MGTRKRFTPEEKVKILEPSSECVGAKLSSSRKHDVDIGASEHYQGN